MLVYLDNAQFAWLQRATADERARFIAEFDSLGAELALSLHHFQEIGQANDRDSIKRRIDVVEQFPIVRTFPASSASVLEHECRAQLVGLSTDDLLIDGRRRFFPRRPHADVRPSLLDHLPVFRQMRDAVELSTEAEGITHGLPKARLSRPLGSVDFDQMLGEMRKNIDAAAEPGSVVHQFLTEITKTLLHNLQSKGTMRDALTITYGLNDLDCASELYDEDLALCASFAWAGKEQAHALLQGGQLTRDDLESRVAQLHPYAAPGFKLQAAVRNGRLRDSKKPEPADQLDEDHVCFAPYVDLMIVDRRTLHYASIESGRRGGLNVNSLRKASSLEDVLNEIRSLARAY